MRNIVLFCGFLCAGILLSCSSNNISGKYMADVSKDMDSVGLIVMFDFNRDTVTGYTSFILGRDTSTEQAFSGAYRTAGNSILITYRDAVGENTFKLFKKNADTLVEKGERSEIIYVRFE